MKMQEVMVCVLGQRPVLGPFFLYLPWRDHEDRSGH